MRERATPYVICHMVPSVDGRIVVDDWRVPQAALNQYDAIAKRLRADAWLVGRISMAPYADGTRTKAAGVVPPGDFIAPHIAKSFAIALDPSGRLVFRRGDIDGEHVIVVVTGRTPRAHLAHLRRKGVSYLVGGDARIDLRSVMARLRARFGIRRILLEGGGKINGAMLRAGLIDELSVLVAPVADGREGTPTLFDAGTGRAQASRLRLLSLKALPGDVAWLRYRVLHD
jgi:2,5-diamino-6-(ribosylamino)-4(3H)-pyrimidinone 5'-phosphate reductase